MSAVVAAVSVMGVVALPVIALGALLLGVAALQQRTQLWELSPVAVLLTAYLTVALLGPLFSNAASQALGASARIVLSAQDSLATFYVFIVAAGGVILGALFASLLVKSKGLPSKRCADGSKHARTWTIFLAMLPAMLTIALYRDALLERPVYLVGEPGAPLVIAAQVLNVPALVALGWLAKSSNNLRGKILSWMSIMVYVIVLFSLATRGLSLIPVLVAIGILAADPSSRKSHWFLLVAAVASIFLLQMPLALRGSAMHGLIPYVGVLFSQQATGTGLAGALSNLLFSYALTGAVAFQAHPIGWASALVSLDPRPGALTDWYTIQGQLNLNPYTPDNALGELANLGLWPTFMFFAVVGAFFAYLDSRIRHLLSSGDTLPALFLFAVSALFVLETLQYNLRSSTRVIYYLIASDMVIRLFLHLRRRHKKSHALFEERQLAGFAPSMEIRGAPDSRSLTFYDRTEGNAG